MNDGDLEEMFEDQEDRDFIRALRPTSFIAVPMRTHDRVLGAIIMVNTTASGAAVQRNLRWRKSWRNAPRSRSTTRRFTKRRTEARTEAERANLAKDRFLAMLSHELRTPLTPVLTSVLALESTRISRRSVRSRAADDPAQRRARGAADRRSARPDPDQQRQGAAAASKVDAHALFRNALEICQSDIDRKTSRSDRPRRNELPPRGRSGAAPADLLEPDQERGQIHRARRPSDNPHP